MHFKDNTHLINTATDNYPVTDYLKFDLRNLVKRKLKSKCDVPVSLVLRVSGHNYNIL